MTRDQAIHRIRAMKATPLMWAITVEGFLLQVAVLLEVCGVGRKPLQAWMSTLDVDHLWTDSVDAHNATKICDSALKLA